ncbi:zinc-dependent alcohol dehydrogenase family protein [Paenibacillus radicis (ex Gao et al. 2016)]|uniref:NADPH:quinone oxidoreductase n=1 Tax=Paenibacillus radicis (ex Gao et al. 2016) TaxID=1737354 RepID=A0A917GUR9_9BACL|nr:NAD(P)-dependent alcohol dehydrogenase [Paenibacillus radicis (ex Gao et al. 2016)]GGG57826.1 NADPH:quinone oxidoreductase [Paenibacillus radicis (ex Gao et al. 2016)]
MKAYVIKDGLGIDYLKQVDLQVPTPGKNEVLIRMRAVSLNARDIPALNGYFNNQSTAPFIPGSDGAGEIIALGEEADKFQIGDRVAGIFNQKWITGEMSPEYNDGELGGSLDGLLAEYVVLSQEGLVRIPEHLSYVEAASLPCAAVTAWHAVVEDGKVKAGDTVVIQGTGGVSIFALQFAKFSGANVIITSSSDDKLEKAKALGANHTINYKTTPDWEKAVLEYTNNRGADLIIEVSGSTLNRSIEAVRQNGQINLIGALSGKEVENLSLLPIFTRKVRLHGVRTGNRDMFEAMNRAIKYNALYPVIDRVFSFANAVDAFKYLEDKDYFGKICISLE